MSYAGAGLELGDGQGSFNRRHLSWRSSKEFIESVHALRAG